MPAQVRLPMTEYDIKTGKELLEEEFIQKNPAWMAELELMVRKGEKAEIQAVSSTNNNTQHSTARRQQEQKAAAMHGFSWAHVLVHCCCARRAVVVVRLPIPHARVPADEAAGGRLDLTASPTAQPPRARAASATAPAHCLSHCSFAAFGPYCSTVAPIKRVCTIETRLRSTREHARNSELHAVRANAMMDQRLSFCTSALLKCLSRFACADLARASSLQFNLWSAHFLICAVLSK